jgi:hypothetical protein
MHFNPNPTTLFDAFLVETLSVTWRGGSSLFTYTGGPCDDAAATQDRRKDF